MSPFLATCLLLRIESRNHSLQPLLSLVTLAHTLLPQYDDAAYEKVQAEIHAELERLRKHLLVVP